MKVVITSMLKALGSVYEVLRTHGQIVLLDETIRTNRSRVPLFYRTVRKQTEKFTWYALQSCPEKRVPELFRYVPLRYKSGGLIRAAIRRCHPVMLPALFQEIPERSMQAAIIMHALDHCSADEVACLYGLIPRSCAVDDALTTRALENASRATIVRLYECIECPTDQQTELALSKCLPGFRDMLRERVKEKTGSTPTRV